MNFSYPKEKYVLIGKVTRAHGIKGELKLIAYSGERRSITNHNSLRLISRENVISKTFTVQNTRGNSLEVITKLDGIDDRNQAEPLVGSGILVAKQRLPALDSGEYYLHELEGLNVVTVDGESLGRVASFLNNGAQEILVIQNAGGEILIPLIPGMVAEWNKAEVIIAPPPGLIELNRVDGAAGNDSP